MSVYLVPRQFKQKKVTKKFGISVNLLYVNDISSKVVGEIFLTMQVIQVIPAIEAIQVMQVREEIH